MVRCDWVASAALHLLAHFAAALPQAPDPHPTNSDDLALDRSFSRPLVGFRMTGDVDANGPWHDLRAGGCHPGLFLTAPTGPQDAPDPFCLAPGGVAMGKGVE